MKITESWIREWVDTPADVQQLAQRLSMAGLEVSAVTPATAGFSDVVVARVLDVRPVPGGGSVNACRVTDGSEEQVVLCAAPGVGSGMQVPWAKPGARLPGGTEISVARMYEMQSHGMLCSARELGLGDRTQSLMRLPDDLQPGTQLCQLLTGDEQILELELTPNRGDCASIRGLAREISALYGTQIRMPFPEPDPTLPPTADAHAPELSLKVSDPQACPVYLGRVIRSVDVSRPTPLWMQRRLHGAGLRSIDAVVDITNYVMLELGQPLHAFDLHQLHGSIDVRYADPGETLTLLGGTAVDLQPDVLLIADDAGPVAMAGIMGGERSGISADTSAPTTDIFLECAFFAPQAIAGRARRYGLQTEASYRYERGVDPHLQHLALARTTELLLELVGGHADAPLARVSVDDIPARDAVQLRHASVTRTLGIEVPWQQVTDILRRLGFQLSGEETASCRVVAPGFRFDVSCEADLIEEVARIYGYDEIPMRQPRWHCMLQHADTSHLELDALRDALVGLGCQEVISYAFVDEQSNDLLAPSSLAVKLENPLSEELSVMRGSLWPGLLGIWARNHNRQHNRARLFEAGRVFSASPGGGMPEQPVKLAVLLAGARYPQGWADDRKSLDFYDMRAICERLIALAGAQQEVLFKASDHPALHPGRSTLLTRNDELLGYMGQLHPLLVERLDIAGDAVQLLELDFSLLSARSRQAFRPPSRFPSVRRDLALELDQHIEAQRVIDLALASGGELVEQVFVFDVFTGAPLADDRKSLALAVILRHQQRTLEDGETGQVINRILQSMSHQLGATQR